MTERSTFLVYCHLDAVILKRRAKKTETRLKKLGFDCHNGFWLDASTFLCADDAEVKVLERKAMSPLGGVEEAAMVILTNVVEILVNDNDKITGVTVHPKLALWSDAIDRALREIKKNPPATA